MSKTQDHPSPSDKPSQLGADAPEAMVEDDLPASAKQIMNAAMIHVEGPALMTLGPGAAGPVMAGATMQAVWDPEALELVKELAARYEAKRQSKEMRESVDPAVDSPTGAPRF